MYKRQADDDGHRSNAAERVEEGETMALHEPAVGMPRGLGHVQWQPPVSCWVIRTLFCRASSPAGDGLTNCRKWRVLLAAEPERALSDWRFSRLFGALRM